MSTPTRKKLLLVITKANWGGAQRYVYDLATELSRETFDVGVAFGQPGRLATELANAGVTTFPLRSLARDLSFRADLASFFELLSLFRTERPDIVHLNSSKAGGIGALAARLAGVPHIVFTAHGWPFLERRNVLWRTFALAGSWATALLAHTVIVVSQNDLAIGRRLPLVRDKMHLVYNGIRMPLTLGSGATIRDTFPPGVRILGTIGELTANKNQIALIERAKADPDLYVAIVGEGEDRPKLEAKIQEYGLGDRVKLFGFLPAAEALAGFDAFALPSHKEGLPYVLIEARAAGLPVEAARVGGVGEVLDASDIRDFSLERMLAGTTARYA